MCWAFGSGLVSASPASEMPLAFVLELELVLLEALPPLAEVLLLLFEPHAATTSTHASATTLISVSRSRRTRMEPPFVVRARITRTPRLDQDRRSDSRIHQAVLHMN